MILNPFAANREIQALRAHCWDKGTAPTFRAIVDEALAAHLKESA